MKTIIRKQGDIITTNSGESEFRIEAKIFTNPEFRICNKYCDLRNKPNGGIFSKIVYALGKDSINDNKAAHFYWDQDCTQCDDGNTVFAVEGTPVGRYVKLTTSEVLQSINGMYSYSVNNTTTQTSIIHIMPCKTVISDLKCIVKTTFSQNATLSLTTSLNNILIHENDVSLTKCVQYDYNICEILETNEQLILTLENNTSFGEATLFYTLSSI